MSFVISLLVNALSVYVAAWILPGVGVEDLMTAVIVAIVLGLVNAFLKPILLLFTLPINLLTLGLFTFVINAALILLVGNIVPGFIVDGFISALLFGLVVSIVNSIFGSIVK